jgi:hypothetical protein
MCVFAVNKFEFFENTGSFDVNSQEQRKDSGGEEKVINHSLICNNSNEFNGNFAF